jgi:hypothetical protein
VERRLLLDVVVGERAAVLELLAREDEALLVRRDALLVLDLRLDVLDRVGRLDLERDSLALRSGGRVQVSNESAAKACARGRRARREAFGRDRARFVATRFRASPSGS